MVPSVAEFMYVDKIKWLEMYGVDLHSVKVDFKPESNGLSCGGYILYCNILSQ